MAKTRPVSYTHLDVYKRQAYDWIYDAWTQEQKDYIVKIIKDFGLAPAAMEYSNGSYGFSKLTHNWNAVCSGGVGIGALAIAEADPEYCTWIVSSGIREMCIRDSRKPLPFMIWRDIGQMRPQQR